jgi:deoxyuridine 5'-triphosphate nucleotidohydrolase
LISFAAVGIPKAKNSRRKENEKTIRSSKIVILYLKVLGLLLRIINPRSGIASKFGVTILNSPATIDSDYIGQVMVILINHGKEPFIINPGDRIAQGVFAPSPTNMFDIVSVKEINKITDRGENGLGSTGIK